MLGSLGGIGLALVKMDSMKMDKSVNPVLNPVKIVIVLQIAYLMSVIMTCLGSTLMPLLIDVRIANSLVRVVMVQRIVVLSVLVMLRIERNQVKGVGVKMGSLNKVIFA